MTRVLLIDDDQEFTALIGAYLEEEGFIVTALGDGSAALDAGIDDFAIVVLDVMMPQLNGLEVLRRIRRGSNVPVLMLTARGDEVDRITGLELGADDYVGKPCTPRELVARIRAILRRTQASGNETATLLVAGDLCLWPQLRRAEWQGQPVVFTSTEFSLLEVLLRNAGRPVSKSELSERALARPYGRHDRSIDVHISSIRRKLGALMDGRSLIQAVHRQGYQLLKE